MSTNYKQLIQRWAQQRLVPQLNGNPVLVVAGDGSVVSAPAAAVVGGFTIDSTSLTNGSGDAFVGIYSVPGAYAFVAGTSSGAQCSLSKNLISFSYIGDPAIQLAGNDRGVPAGSNELGSGAISVYKTAGILFLKVSGKDQRVYFGSTSDVNLYWGGADTLKTDDGFVAAYYAGSTQTLTGPGAANVTTETTKITTTGNNDAITLANGVDGQTKTILHEIDGGSFVLTPTTATGWTTYTSTLAGQSITLRYATTRGWFVIGSFGGTIG